MSKLFSKSLTNPTFFQYGFIVLITCSILLNGFIIVNENNFYILYIFCAILLGIGYYNRSVTFIVALTLFIVLCRVFLIPERGTSIAGFVTYFFTYLLITFISVGLMKNVQRVINDHIELTKALANALDSRDRYTLHHSENVAKYATEIAKRMKLSKELCNVIQIGALLHDIGKIGIPEYVLNKPGKLTECEYSVIKDHPTIGFEIIKHISNFQSNGVLDIVLYHHERYDGKGYPKGLKGEEIPLLARIVAVADSFDAMSSKRVYRNELDYEYVLHELYRNRGTQFDPNVVDIFLSLFQEEKEFSQADHEIMTIK